MAINCTWSVNDMTRNNVDGGVFLVHWSCVALSDGEPAYSSMESGKLRLTYNAVAADFIPYADLTEANVLGWVYDSLKEGDETADEAKARVEADRTAKVQAEIDRLNNQSNGLPWAT